MLIRFNLIFCKCPLWECAGAALSCCPWGPREDSCMKENSGTREDGEWADGSFQASSSYKVRTSLRGWVREMGERREDGGKGKGRGGWGRGREEERRRGRKERKRKGREGGKGNRKCMRKRKNKE